MKLEKVDPVGLSDVPKPKRSTGGLGSAGLKAREDQDESIATCADSLPVDFIRIA